MSGQRHLHAVHAWSGRMAGQRDARAPRRARNTVGVVLVLIFAAVVVSLLFEAPQIAWLGLLTAALVLLDVALALGIRQWMRDRMR